MLLGSEVSDRNRKMRSERKGTCGRESFRCPQVAGKDGKLASCNGGYPWKLCLFYFFIWLTMVQSSYNLLFHRSKRASANNKRQPLESECCGFWSSASELMHGCVVPTQTEMQCLPLGPSFSRRSTRTYIRPHCFFHKGPPESVLLGTLLDPPWVSSAGTLMPEHFLRSGFSFAHSERWYPNTFAL